MRRAVLALALLSCAPIAGAQDYEALFGRRWEAAADLVLMRASSWERRLHDLHADPESLVPVVFPELLRHSQFRSEVESLGLGTLYVTNGTAAADFSTGRFQMKPSFVEALETAVLSLPDAPAEVRRIGVFPDAATDAQKRAQRLGRIQKDDWQLVYLASFYLVEENRFGVAAMPVRERIRFLAAAYNHGFLRPREEIEAAGLLRFFPDGRAFGRSAPFRYADVAVDFYDRLWRLIAGSDDDGRIRGIPGPASRAGISASARHAGRLQAGLLPRVEADLRDVHPVARSGRGEAPPHGRVVGDDQTVDPAPGKLSNRLQ